MVAYSFKPRFVEPILAGTKRQTIRAPRKSRHARPGEQLQLYTGMRTRHCKLIAKATCDQVDDISLYFVGTPHIVVGCMRVEDPEALDWFARRDGFSDFDAMARFWRETHRLSVFDGTLIGWAPIAGTPAAEMAGA